MISPDGLSECGTASESIASAICIRGTTHVILIINQEREARC